jgi:hypothetical protein
LRLLWTSQSQTFLRFMALSKGGPTVKSHFYCSSRPQHKPGTKDKAARKANWVDLF